MAATEPFVRLNAQSNQEELNPTPYDGCQEVKGYMFAQCYRLSFMVGDKTVTVFGTLNTQH